MFFCLYSDICYVYITTMSTIVAQYNCLRVYQHLEHPPTLTYLEGSRFERKRRSRLEWIFTNDFEEIVYSSVGFPHLLPETNPFQIKLRAGKDETRQMSRRHLSHRTYCTHQGSPNLGLCV